MIVEALWLAERRRHARAKIHQPPYSIFKLAAIAPRAQEQRDDLLCGVSARLDDTTLDAIVVPGSGFNPADADWTPRPLTETRLRRQGRSSPIDQPSLPEWSKTDKKEETP